LAQRVAFPAEIVHLRPHPSEPQLGGCGRNAGALQHPDLALQRTDLPAHPPSRCEPSRASQRAQIVRNVAELADHLRVSEIVGRRISHAVEAERADVAGSAGKRFDTPSPPSSD
jgi:hypothetical protein